MRKFILGAVMLALATPAMAQGVTLRVITPAVTANSGLRDLAMGFEKEMGVKVDIVTLNMAKMGDELKGGTPPADVVFMPYALMDQAQASNQVASGSRINIGRVRIGLAVHKGDGIPDISTVDKLAAVLKAADSVMYSDPTSGSMEARIIDGMLNAHPEFAGREAQDQPQRRRRPGGGAWRRPDGAAVDLRDHQSSRRADQCRARCRIRWAPISTARRR